MCAVVVIRAGDWINGCVCFFYLFALLACLYLCLYQILLMLTWEGAVDAYSVSYCHPVFDGVYYKYKRYLFNRHFLNKQSKQRRPTPKRVWKLSYVISRVFPDLTISWNMTAKLGGQGQSQWKSICCYCIHVPMCPAAIYFPWMSCYICVPVPGILPSKSFSTSGAIGVRFTYGESRTCNVWWKPLCFCCCLFILFHICSFFREITYPWPCSMIVFFIGVVNGAVGWVYMSLLYLRWHSQPLMSK